MTTRTLYRWCLTALACLSTAPGTPGADSFPQPDSQAWENTLILAVEAEIDPAAAREWLPDGLPLDSPARATFFVARYPQSDCCGPYDEAGILLDVRHMLLPAKHCPWMVVNDDTALLLGRDVLGFPKKMADISLSVNRDTGRVEASVERNGTRVLDMTGWIGDDAVDAPGVFDGRMVNVWGVVPMLSLDGLVNVPHLLSFNNNEVIRLAKDVAIERFVVSSGPSDPLADILPGTVRGAWLYRTDLPSGGLGAIPLAWDEVDGTYVERTWSLRLR